MEDSRMTDRHLIGEFTSPHEMLALIRQRQEQLGLSNEALEEICSLAAGTVNKYLGPTCEKMPNLFTTFLLLNGVGLSGSLHVDADKEAQFGWAWKRQGRRREKAVRPPDKVSKIAVRRARPVVLSEGARKAALARWKATPPAERRAHCRMMQEAKSLARKER